MKDLEQCRGGIRALQVPPQSNELPSLAVNHGCVGGAFEEIDAIHDGREHFADAGTELRLSIGRVNLMKEAIDALPLLGGDFFADLAGIFARRADAEGDGGGIELIEDELVRHLVKRSVPGHAGRPAERRHHALPLRLNVGAVGIEHQAQSHVELPDGILRPLKIAAHPVEAVSDARYGKSF